MQLLFCKKSPNFSFFCVLLHDLLVGSVDIHVICAAASLSTVTTVQVVGVQNQRMSQLLSVLVVNCVL